MSGEVLALVNYYARAGYYRHLQTVCNEVLKKRGSTDPTLVFWRALGMLKEGAVNDAIRDWEGIKSRGDLQLALPAKLALVHAHQMSKVVDGEEVHRLQNEVSVDEQNAPDRARLTAALLLWHLGELDEAKMQVTRLLQMQPQYVPALTLMGWLELQAVESDESHMVGMDDPEQSLARAESAFEDALAACSAKKDLEALMGKARVLLLKRRYKQALEELNQVIVLYAWFLPALVEKFSVLVAMGDWDQAVETAQRVLSQDQHNIEALRLSVLFLLSQESRYDAAKNRISDLLQALDRHEPQNAELYFRAARPFARLAARRADVLQLTQTLVDRACKLAPGKAEYAAEYAYHQMLLGDLRGAANSLRNAGAMEEGSQEVMQHQIKCQVLSGQLEEAEQQLEFLAEIQASMELTPEMAFCSALLATSRGQPRDDCVALLDQAAELHMRALQGATMSGEFFVKLNPDLLIEIARAYLTHCGTEPEVLDPTSPDAVVLSRATKLLQTVVAQAPGVLDGQILLAQAHYLASNYDAALRCCAMCVKADASFAAASLLHAQILLRLEKYKAAHAVLEQALAHNFAIKESPVYNMIKAKALHTQGESEEARATLEKAMQLPGVRSATAEQGGRGGVRFAEADTGAAPLSAHDRCSIHLLLAEVYVALALLDKAGVVMQQAIFEFSAGPQEGRVTIATAQLEMQRGEVERALTMLRAIQTSNPHYNAARKVMAELYLNYRNDERAYAQCHEELVRANPTTHSFVMLGEAYMQINQADKAIAAFESALRKSPGDASLASRIGKVLVTTHEYVKAIEYYSTAVHSDPTKQALRYELAELYLELQKYDQAEKELRALLSGSDAAELQLDTAFLHVQSLLLLARVYTEQELMERVAEALGTARTTQTNLLARVRVEASDQLSAQREVAAEICFRTALMHELLRDPVQARTSYEEALKHDDTHEKGTLALARLHLVASEIDEAQALCTSLMRIEPGSEAGSMMLADLMLQKSEWEAAIAHFQQLLEATPAHFKAMVKLLQLLRRAGRLKEASRFLVQAERSSPRAALEPGFRFCQGLLHRYMNDPRAALKALNMARRDPEWGELAVQNMVEIYLNPENETNWDEIALDQRQEAPEAVRAAEVLLQEMPRSPRQQVLEAYTLVAYRQKAQIEKAISQLLELLNIERDYLPALVCLSQAYLMLKQSPKARNHLKRVAKMHFLAEMADDFEQGWLMLADVYIGGGKYDLAEELCRRCLASNKSCAKAWEFLGVVKEKEMSYKDAASHYENAWKYENESSAAVGYKLSFNYLKAKKYVDAIDVCHKVLQQFPDYPKIRKDVLEKARQALKP